jgi:predicted small integral membrane protein
MAYQTTVGWSLLTSGVVTLLLVVLPGKSLWWGLALLILGLIVLVVRRDDVSDAVGSLS